MLRKLAVHVSNYSTGSLLVMISGFVSFPILTRIFSVDDYGTLNLISATLALLVGIAKLGVQNSIVRFNGDVMSGKLEGGLDGYRSTTLFGMLAVAGVVTVAWIGISQLIPASWWSDRRMTALWLLTSVLVIIRVADSCLTNVLRAEERSAEFSVYSVLKRYSVLVLVLVTLFYLSRSVYGFFGATIVAEAGAVAILFGLLSRGCHYSPRRVSVSLFRKMLVFGMPMIAFELAGITLNLGDRYVVEGVLGSHSLGLYSAGYNLCEYVQIVMLASISQAIVPMYVRCWTENGDEATGQFLRRALHYYLMLALPVVAGLSAIGGQLVVLLASSKYAASAVVVPWVVAGMAVDAAVTIVGAGLYIYKRTFVLAGLVTACAVLNVILNLLLVPYWNITGAAVATFVCYAVLGLSVLKVSSRAMPIAFPWASAAKFAVLAGGMYIVVSRCPAGGTVAGMGIRVVVGVASYIALALIFDRSARSIARTGLAWCYARP